MSSFEMAMPVVGLLFGHGLGAAIGGIADYVAAAALLTLGGWMLFAEDDDEGEKVSALSSRGGLALIGLGISISLDELAMGFTIGLLHLSIVLAVVLIGIQAFAVAQLGLRLGARLGDAAFGRSAPRARVRATRDPRGMSNFEPARSFHHSLAALSPRFYRGAGVGRAQR